MIKSNVYKYGHVKKFIKKCAYMQIQYFKIHHLSTLIKVGKELILGGCVDG
jgi:hypothetical protein